MSGSLWPQGLQHTRLPCHLLSPGVCLHLSIESVMLPNHLILCSPLLLLPSIFPSIRVFFQWVGSSPQVAKLLEFQLQRQYWAYFRCAKQWVILWVSMNKKALSLASNNWVTRWEREIVKHSWFIVAMQNYLSIATKIFIYFDLFSSRDDL